ncbi:PREDICTED: protein msta, isoform B-like [Dufourea novaeangliae]|uniref:Protein msta, isoform B n=1 Tax=Dufourea novaeangliae TaxID=178035 RepID=A0A154P0F2_DUFNO|nr:PREDICTED: protein msta, isoform B-like [Dufourea novaeangliae]KZC05302.1 Protein msta, isoform B [Dufourea novaeangliae]
MSLPEVVVDPDEVKELLVSHLRTKKILRDGVQPWTVGYSRLGGRGLFATRDIKANELIFVDSPLVIGPRCVVKQHLRMCVRCYKTECPLFPCDRGCGLPVCSTRCENSPDHADRECAYLRSLVPRCGTDWSLELLPTVIPIRGLYMTEEQRKCFAAFQCDQTLTPCYEIELLQRNVTNPPSEEELKLMRRVCGAFNTNAFETVSVQDKDHSSSLRGLYPMGALQNHCCAPNTRHHFDGEQRLYVNASLPIAAGEELTMSYTSLFWDTTLRRQFLNVTKHFACACKRCSDPTEFGSRLGALLCASDHCSGNLLPRDPLNMTSPWVCDKCLMTMHNRQISSIRSGLAAIMEEALYKTPRQIYKFMQKELSIIMPANNYLIMDIKFRIISYYGRAEGVQWPDLTIAELDTKVKYCNDLLSILNTLNCGDCKKKGLILYELYCTNMEKMRRLRQQQNIRNEDAHLPVQNNENEHLLEKAMTILQNDVVAVVTFEHDKQFFKQC